MPIDPGPSTADLIQLAVGLGTVALVGVGGVALLKRASRRRREQIEQAGQPRTVAPEPRKNLAPEPEENDDELPPAEEPSAAGSTVPDRAAAPPGAGAGTAARSASTGPGRPLPSEAAPAEMAETRGAQVIPFLRPVTPAPQQQPPVAKPIGAPSTAPARVVAEPVDKPQPAAPARPRKKDGNALAPGLAKTRAGWVSRIGQLFVGKREIDPNLVVEMEKVLLTADIGVRTSTLLLDEIRRGLDKNEIADPAAVWAFLRRRSAEILELDAQPVDLDSRRPFVLLVIGVNGSGKTTTIGKLAAKLVGDGKKVLLAAGDTFRAAATEQLEIWGNRVGATIVRGKEGADPSSVIFEGVKKGKAEGFDVVIADTAGRLHTKTELMDELGKVRRVIGKAAEGAPHETWLVIDATQGQNAIAQAQVFTQAMQVTGIVLTKLDGTAKGGVILGIADQLKIPVRYVGIGERVEDLREFDAEEFVEALFETA